MKFKAGIWERGTSNNHTITNNTVYGKFIFFESKNVKLEIVSRNNKDNVELRNEISIL